MNLVADAQVLADQQQWQAAADLLTGAPPTVEVLSRRCFYLSRAKRYDEALELLAELRRREPTVVRWPYMTGYQYYEQQRYAEALPWLEAARQLKPDHLKTIYRLAHTYEHVGQQRQAEKAAGRVLALWHAASPEEQDRERTKLANASYILGRAMMKRGQRGDAMPLLQQAVEHDPGDHDKRYRLGKLLHAMGKSDSAIVSLRSALKLKPTATYIELELAATLADAGIQAEGRQHLKAVARRCRGWNAYKGGKIAETVGELPIAVELFEQASRDRDTRNELCVREALAAVRALVPATNSVRPNSLSAGGERSEGTVDVVNVDRRFGFLIGDDRIRRHFRLRACDLKPGDRVSFVALAGEKGSSAAELKRIKDQPKADDRPLEAAG